MSLPAHVGERARDGGLGRREGGEQYTKKTIYVYILFIYSIYNQNQGLSPATLLREVGLG